MCFIGVYFAGYDNPKSEYLKELYFFLTENIQRQADTFWFDHSTIFQRLIMETTSVFVCVRVCFLFLFLFLFFFSLLLFSFSFSQNWSMYLKTDPNFFKQSNTFRNRVIIKQLYCYCCIIIIP